MLTELRCSWAWGWLCVGEASAAVNCSWCWHEVGHFNESKLQSAPLWLGWHQTRQREMHHQVGSVFTVTVVKVKSLYSAWWEPVTELWSYGIAQCCLPPDISECTFSTPAKQASTRFSYPGGYVDLYCTVMHNNPLLLLWLHNNKFCILYNRTFCNCGTLSYYLLVLAML